MQERLLGHRPRTADFPRCARTAAGSQYHVGVEHREKRVEAADAYASDKGDNNFTLTARIGMRGRFTTHWRGRLRELPPRRRGARHDGSDFFERCAKDVVQDQGLAPFPSGVAPKWLTAAILLRHKFGLPVN